MMACPSPHEGQWNTLEVGIWRDFDSTRPEQPGCPWLEIGVKKGSLERGKFSLSRERLLTIFADSAYFLVNFRVFGTAVWEG